MWECGGRIVVYLREGKGAMTNLGDKACKGMQRRVRLGSGLSRAQGAPGHDEHARATAATIPTVQPTTNSHPPTARYYVVDEKTKQVSFTRDGMYQLYKQLGE
jgi:hypothetical protein